MIMRNNIKNLKDQFSHIFKLINIYFPIIGIPINYMKHTWNSLNQYCMTTIKIFDLGCFNSYEFGLTLL